MLFKGLLNKDERQLIWRKLTIYDLEMLHWAIDPNRVFIETVNFAFYATFHGYLDLIGLFNESFYPIICHTAIFNGQCNVLDCIKKRGYIVNENHFIFSIRSGTLDTVKWYLHNGINIDNVSLYDFVTSFNSSNIHIFEWIVENDYGIDLIGCQGIADNNGNFEIAEWIDQRNH